MCMFVSSVICTETLFFRRKIAMRVRSFFWFFFLLSCLSVLTFAFLFQENIPAVIELSLDQPFPKVQHIVALTLHLTDTEGLPINNASVISSFNMTNMNMGKSELQLQFVGQGKYMAHLQFSMAGPWQITTIAHAKGILPAQ